MTITLTEPATSKYETLTDLLETISTDATFRAYGSERSPAPTMRAGLYLALSHLAAGAPVPYDDESTLKAAYTAIVLIRQLDGCFMNLADGDYVDWNSRTELRRSLGCWV